MYRVFGVLIASPAAQFVCFPFGNVAGVADVDTKLKMSPALLFPNLRKAGYQCHLPQDRRVALMYTTALRKAVDTVHEAGIVHGDMYSSNVMW